MNILTMASIITQGRKFREVRNIAATSRGFQAADTSYMAEVDNFLIAEVRHDTNIDDIMVVSYSCMCTDNQTYVSAFAVGIKYED